MIHFAVHLKLIQHCKSTMLQSFLFLNKGIFKKSVISELPHMYTENDVTQSSHHPVPAHILHPSPSHGLPCGSAGKESTCSVGDLGSIPGLGRSPGEGKGYLLQDSGLENSRDCIVYGIAKSWTQLSDFPFHFFPCPMVGKQRNGPEHYYMELSSEKQ